VKFIIQKLSFEGDFFALTRVLNQLEKTKGIGVLRSVSLRRPKSNTNDNNTGKLKLDIYFETIRE